MVVSPGFTQIVASLGSKKCFFEFRLAWQDWSSVRGSQEFQDVHVFSFFFFDMWLWVKKGYPKTLLVKGNEQYLMHGHVFVFVFAHVASVLIGFVFWLTYVVKHFTFLNQNRYLEVILRWFQGA